MSDSASASDGGHRAGGGREEEVPCAPNVRFGHNLFEHELHSFSCSLHRRLIYIFTMIIIIILSTHNSRGAEIVAHGPKHTMHTVRCASTSASVMIWFDIMYYIRLSLSRCMCAGHLHAKWKTIFNILGIDKV